MMNNILLLSKLRIEQDKKRRLLNEQFEELTKKMSGDINLI